MFCKSGILIFIYAENNYLIYAHTLLIKTPLLHQSLGPRVFLSFFLSFSLSLSLYFWLIPWSSEAHWAHFLAGLLRPSWEGNCAFTHSRGHLVPMCSSASPENRTLLAFRINQGYQPPSLSYFLIVDSGPPASIKGPISYLKIYLFIGLCILLSIFPHLLPYLCLPMTTNFQRTQVIICAEP